MRLFNTQVVELALQSHIPMQKQCSVYVIPKKIATAIASRVDAVVSFYASRIE